MILQARKWYRSMKVFRRANYGNDKWTPGTLMNIIEGGVVKGMVFLTYTAWQDCVIRRTLY